MGKKNKGPNLGRSLIRDRFTNSRRRTVDSDSMVNILKKYPKTTKHNITSFLFILVSYHRSPRRI